MTMVSSGIVEDTDLQPLSPAFVALGNRVTKAGELLESFPKPEFCVLVTMTSDEFTANCPITEQPDWYTVEIQYEPSDRCIESKSLKLYLHSFRNQGAFVESLGDIILAHVVESVAPISAKVRLVQKARGGISIETTSYVEMAHEILAGERV